MLLSEFLYDVSVSNSTNVSTPIELSYYDDYSWQDLDPVESMFFASLDFAYANSGEFIDGELMGLEVTDLGLTLHVVSTSL